MDPKYNTKAFGTSYLPHFYDLTWKQDDVSPASATSPTAAGMDFIYAARGTWQSYDQIDGGGGYDTISGYFPTINTAEAFAPRVKNVEAVEVMAESNFGTLNFANWTGLQYAEIHGTGNPGTDVLTAFRNIPLTAKIGVENFTKQAFFKFAGADGSQSIELTVDHTGTPGSPAVIDIAKMGGLQAHIIGQNFFQLNGNSFKTLSLDGNGTVAIDFLAQTQQGVPSLITKVDASAMSGKFGIQFLDNDYIGHAVNIVGSQGGSTVWMTGDFADRIVFGAGADTYHPSQLHNLSVAGANLSTNAGLDATAIQISNFIHGQDRLDFTALGSGNALYIDTHSASQLGSSLRSAAEFVAANDMQAVGRHTFDVFQFNNSTYVFNDANGDNRVDSHDGLIRLVNATGINQLDFMI